MYIIIGDVITESTWMQLAPQHFGCAVDNAAPQHACAAPVVLRLCACVSKTKFFINQ